MQQWTAKLVVILINGFRQGLRSPTGMEKLYNLATRRYEHEPRVKVSQPLSWKSNWKSQAAFIQRHAPTNGEDARARIMVSAYSFGAGWGFQKLTRELNERGLAVDVAILIDPVYRSPLLPTWLPLNLVSMTTLGHLKIRENVRRLHYFRQFQNRPRGRACIAADPYATEIRCPIELDCTHQLADDHPRVRELFTAQLDQLAASVGIHPHDEDTP